MSGGGRRERGRVHTRAVWYGPCPMKQGESRRLAGSWFSSGCEDRRARTGARNNESDSLRVMTNEGQPLPDTHHTNSSEGEGWWNCCGGNAYRPSPLRQGQGHKGLEDLHSPRSESSCTTLSPPTHPHTHTTQLVGCMSLRDPSSINTCRRFPVLSLHTHHPSEPASLLLSSSINTHLFHTSLFLPSRSLSLSRFFIPSFLQPVPSLPSLLPSTLTTYHIMADCAAGSNAGRQFMTKIWDKDRSTQMASLQSLYLPVPLTFSRTEKAKRVNNPSSDIFILGSIRECTSGCWSFFHANSGPPCHGSR